MITINEIGYYYFQSSNSTTRNGLRLKDFDLIEVCEELYQLSKKFGGNIEYYAMIKNIINKLCIFFEKGLLFSQIYIKI